MRHKISIFFLTQLFIILANLPIIYSFQKTPKSTIYPLIDTARFGDYNGYLAAITQGQNHYFYFHDPYTNEQVTANFYYWPYLLIGWLTSLFNIWPPFVYHGLKIISSELFCLALFLIVKLIFTKNNVLFPYFLALTSTVAPSFIFRIFNIPSTTDWWQLQDAIPRLSQAPHHLIGEFLLLMSMYFLIKRIKIQSAKYLYLECILIFIAGTIFPPVIFPYLISNSIIVLYHVIKNKRLNIQEWIPIIITIGVGIINIIQLNMGFHKIVWGTWEVARWNFNEPQFDKIFFLCLGIPLFVLITVLVKKLTKITFSTMEILLTSWFFTPLFVLPISTIIGVSKIRLFAMLPQISLSILMYYLLNLYIDKKLIKTIALLIILISITTSGFLLSENIYSIGKSPIYSNVYYPQETWKLITFVKNNIKQGAIVLSNEQLGNILPAYTPVVSYFGHINLTINFKVKQNNVWRFYTLRMSEKEAKQFIQDNKISYIFWGEDEKALGEKTLSYTFLKSIYETKNTTIYRVI